MKIAGLVLAAGSSSRLGQPKQLVLHCGKPLLQHIIEKQHTVCDDIFVALGSETEMSWKLSVELQSHPIKLDNWRAGMGASLSEAISHIPDLSIYHGLLVSPCDQPFIKEEHFHKLISNFDGDCPLATAWNDGPDLISGAPVLWPARYFPTLATLKGDNGARTLLRSIPHQTVLCTDAKFDLDTAENVTQLSR